MDAVADEPGTSLSLANPAALIEVLDAHQRIQSRFRLNARGDVCKLGRSLVCDIVLDDLYAAPEHTQVTLRDDGRIEVTDLGSRNGTRIDGERIPTETPALITGGELIVGRTRVRIRTALTELAPERVFRRDLLQRHRTLLASIGLILCAGYAVFGQWIAYPEPLAPRILTAAVGAVAAIAVWVSVWALITRVGQGSWTLRAHTAIAANLVALCLWSDWLFSVAAFATQWRWLQSCALLIVGIAILCALYLHIRKATHLTERTAAVVAISLPLTLISVSLWIAQQSNVGNVNRLSPALSIYPPQLRVTASADLSDYLAGLDSLKREANRKRRQSLIERPLAKSE